MNAPALHLEPAGSLTVTRMTVPGMKCAGCIGKIERELAKTPGIAAARANLSAKRVAISHDPALDEEALAAALLALGFEARPVADADLLGPQGQHDAERRRLTRALGVAGFGMMNIMLLSVSVWSGAEGATRALFHWLSAAIALPVPAGALRQESAR